MSLLLDVPYIQREEVKKRGAKWNTELKKWYVENFLYYPYFIEWLPSSSVIIVCSKFYILEGKRTCYKCGKETRVIGYGLRSYCEVEYENIACYRPDSFLLASSISPLPPKILEYVQSHWNIQYTYTQTVGKKYFANMCDHCNAIQGGFHLFHEMDTPFDESNHNKLVITELQLQYDFVVEEVELAEHEIVKIMTQKIIREEGLW